MKAATDYGFYAFQRVRISIHAAREGGDAKAFLDDPENKISIHAAREGGDPFLEELEKLYGKISIHAAREGGDVTAHCRNDFAHISIHAAREGGDIPDIFGLCLLQYFNPRRP